MGINLLTVLLLALCLLKATHADDITSGNTNNDDVITNTATPGGEGKENEEGIVQLYIDTWEAMAHQGQRSNEKLGHDLKNLHDRLKAAGLSPSIMADLDDVTGFKVDEEGHVSIATSPGEGGDTGDDRRTERAVESGDSKRWTGGIVPYVFTGKYTLLCHLVCYYAKDRCE